MTTHHRKFDGPDTPHSRRFDNINIFTKVSGAILAAAGVTALCWRLMAEPCVQRQIDKSLNPVVDVLEYQTYLMMQNLTDEQLKKADESYVATKRARVHMRNAD